MSPLTWRNASSFHASFWTEFYNQAPAKMMIYIIYIYIHTHTHIYIHIRVATCRRAGLWVNWEYMCELICVSAGFWQLQLPAVIEWVSDGWMCCTRYYIYEGVKCSLPLRRTAQERQYLSIQEGGVDVFRCVKEFSLICVLLFMTNYGCG